MTQKIKKASSVDLVFEKVMEAIHDNVWEIGDKLPSENDLSQLYGVNRLTVRMALQKLNTIGLVKTRVGEGSFVRQFEFSRYIDQTATFDITSDMLNSVCDFRKLLEVECARLAMDAATGEEKEELYHLLQLMLDAKRRQITDNDSGHYFFDYTDADLNFHHHICKMSHNILYVRAFEMAKPAIEKYVRLKFSKEPSSHLGKGTDEKAVTTDIHLVIYQAIVNRDFELCRAKYVEMLDFRNVM
jgi:GntR family transcriptional repressor for pyruvate dehydrogenase complex